MTNELKHLTSISFASWSPCFLAAALAVLGAPRLSVGQEEAEPVLRLEANGPTSYVTALAFSPDGQTLYAGSWDKTVYVWRLDAAAHEFRLDPLATLRVPIGPGLDGAVNAIAVSPDGDWVAAAGTSPIRGAADFRRPGQVIPTLGGMTSEMRQDAGTIYVFNVHTGQTLNLRGHRGEVRALAFAPSHAEKPVLVSAAREWNETQGLYEGVVRVWQAPADDARPIQRVLPVPSGEDSAWTTWPKLAARRTGDDWNAIEVAIAWGDGMFRVWDVGSNRLAEAAGQGRFQDTVALRGPAGPFFTGAQGDDEGLRLRAWQQDTAATLAVDPASSVETPRTQEYRIVPRGLTFAASEKGQVADLLCAVVHRNVVANPASDQYELWLYKSPFRGVRPQTAALWNVGAAPRRTPQLATSPGGEHLAVTRESEVHVHAVADLLAGRNQPKVLRNAGAAFDEVAFVRRRGASGPTLGLRLSEPRLPVAGAPRPADKAHVVLDFERGTLASQVTGDGWSQASPAAAGWRADVQASPAGKQAGGRQLVISQNGQRRGVIALPANADRARYALSASTLPPVVALATYETGLPALGLYDAATGRQIRQLTAHSALIRSLAFSDDGQLLASVADDETVCLWRLADLHRIAGKRGKTPGIAVRQSRAGMVVNFNGAAATAGLAEGDVLLGHVTVGGSRPWGSPREFYDAFWNATPGETVRVKRRQTNGAEDEIAIPVIQGIDERKPLFSLFITRGLAGQPRQWIGWSPLGPYQSSGQNVERYLGWHFNTGRPEAPVAFAQAAQYRERYYREGLIGALIKTGQPPEDKQAGLPLPRPIMDLVVEGGEGAPGGGAEDVLVRQPPTRASLLVADLVPSQIDKIELALNGQRLAALVPHADGTTWSAPLDPTAWRPGEYRLQAIVHTREAAPQQFDVERRVRYQAPAPQVTIGTEPGGVSGLHVDQATLPFTATIEPAAKGEPTEVALKRKNSAGETVVKKWTITERLEINENIELGEGGNQVEVVAVTRNAPAGQEPQETERKQLTINRHKSASAPAVVSAKVEPVTSGQVGEPLELGYGPRIVTVNRVRISGEITGAKEPLMIESNLAKEGTPLRIAPAVDGKPAAFDTADIELKPGKQTFLVRQKELEGPAVTTTIELDYRPPLPELVIVRPQADQVLVAGRDQPNVEIAARLQGLPPDPTFQATVLVNGEPIDAAPKIDREARTLSAQVPVKSGESNIEIKLWDTWNEARVLRAAAVKFLHLPSIDKITAKNEQTPVIELALSGKSATPLTQVQLGNDVLPASAIQYDDSSGVWQATAQVSRKPTAYDVAIQARNRDGESLAPGKWQVPAWRQLQPPPAIELASPSNVTSASYDLRFTVRSRSALRSVNVKHNRQPVPFSPDLAGIEPDASGWHVYAGTLPMQLASGDNRFEVLAANDGGSDFQQTLVNYIDPPAQIVIDSLETVAPARKQTLPVIVKDRRAHAAARAPTGKVLVRGRVNWPLSTDKTYLSRPQRLQLRVNGFQQAPGILEQPTKNNPSSEFSAFAVLNEKENNHIELALPDLTPDIATLFDCEVDCDEPVREQRLHVLIVGVGAPRGSEPELENRVLDALQARPLRDKLWQSARFNQIAPYGPLVGNDITPQQVRSQLSSIKLKIDELYQTNRTTARPANDVVIIYLQGGALINAGENFYVTTKPASDPRTSRAVRQLDPRILLDVAVQSRTLVNFLTHTTGAHVLMLDVTGDQAGDEAALWPADSRAAMLRYTWLKDSLAPARARLIAALPEALERTGKLSQLDTAIAEHNRGLADQFPGSSTYSRRVPSGLQNLMIGAAP